MKLGRAAATESEWAAFCRKYRAEMASPEAKHAVALLATLSHASDFSVGCYCDEEARCHRSVLRHLLADAGARIANEEPAG